MADDYHFDFPAEWKGPLVDMHSSDLIILRSFTLVVLITLVTLGVPGNLLVILSILRVNNLKKVSNWLLINLAIYDLGVMSMDVMQILGVVLGESVFLSRWVCETSGIVCMISCYGSLWSMALIAFNKYLHVIHKPTYDKLFGKKGTLISMLIVFIICLTLDAPNFHFIGYSAHAYVASSLHCAFVLAPDWLYNVLMYSVVAVVCPCAVNVFCYYQIWKYSTSSEMMRAGNVSERRRSEQRQLVNSLMAIFIAIFITWLPFAGLLFFLGLDANNARHVPLGVMTVLEMWAHGNSALNWIIYGLFNRSFRRAYKQVICSLFCRCGKQANTGEDTQVKSDDDHQTQAKISTVTSIPDE